jgi:hypothetical protein
VRENKFALCAADIVNERGRVWLATKDHVFSRQDSSLLVISRVPPSSLAVRLRQLWPGAEQVVPVLALLAACLCLWLHVWLTGEKPRYRPLARAFGAALLAPPFVFLTALTIDTIGIHASPALLVGPIAATCAMLPTFGAWVGDRLSRGRQQVPTAAPSLLLAFVGTLVGGVFGVSFLLSLLRHHADGSTALAGTLISSIVVGSSTALGYLRVSRSALPQIDAAD